jgi:hypothetical protein
MLGCTAFWKHFPGIIQLKFPGGYSRCRVFPPKGFRETSPDFLRDPLGGLIDHFEGANDRLGGFVICKKTIPDPFPKQNHAPCE